MSLPGAAGAGRDYPRTAVLLALLALAGVPRLSHAQRDDIVVESTPAPEPQTLQERRMGQLVEARFLAAGAQQRGQVSDDTIYQWIFGTARNADAATKLLESKLRIKILEFERHRRANEEQKKKLELAGQVDIRRWMDRVDELLRQGQAGKHDLTRVNEVHRQAVRLGQSVNAGLFDEESFFAKTARHLFTREHMEETDRQRQSLEHQDHAQQAAALLKIPLRLTDQQEQSLVELLRTQTRPPRRPGEYGFQVALFDMQRLPEGKLKPLFSDAQWDLLQRQFEQVKWLEPYLKQNGFLHDMEPATAKAEKR